MSSVFGLKVRPRIPTVLPRALLPSITYLTDPYDVAEGADAVAIVTEWDAFRALDLKRLAAKMRDKHLIDLRNIYHRPEVERAGLSYSSVGR